MDKQTHSATIPSQKKDTARTNMVPSTKKLGFNNFHTLNNNGSKNCHNCCSIMRVVAKQIVEWIQPRLTGDY